MSTSLKLSTLLVLAAAACAAPIQVGTGTAVQLTPIERDVHSYARPNEARVTHVVLDLATDFAAKTLAGTATLTVARAPGAREIVLDTKGLTILGVTEAGGTQLEYRSGATDPFLGTPLTIALPTATDRIVIRYHTNPDASALQWLSPAQTAGKQHPYLFSQGQAILTRTWIPTQDSPGVRQTYEARITVPSPLRAVMSAEQLTPEGEAAPGGRAFRFKLDQAVPPYLIAIAVGDIAFRPLGPRTGVYAEPSVVDSAAREFIDVERMVNVAESIYGPYRWGRYDLLVLPPSFPFGGMENPRLTFATPTILAGDRSLVSLVAHELAHSWSGNLVTNATWSDFWLNEGFTTYFENRIMEAMYGTDIAVMLQQLERQDLDAEIAGFGADTAETVLHLALEGRDPDEGMTQVAYNKGSAFLRMLERAVGRERFDTYLRSYFDRHAFQPMTTARFLADMKANLLGGDDARYRELQVDRWVYGAGVPANYPVATSDRFAKVEAQARAFAQGTSPAGLATSGWITQEWQHFIGSLPDTMTTAQMAALDRQFHFTQSGNSEVLFAWLRAAIASRYEPAMPALERFLTSQGRRKFVLPLYQDLMKAEWGKPVARRIFAVARPLYHPVAANSIDAVVK